MKGGRGKEPPGSQTVVFWGVAFRVKVLGFSAEWFFVDHHKCITIMLEFAEEFSAQAPANSSLHAAQPEMCLLTLPSKLRVVF